MKRLLVIGNKIPRLPSIEWEEVPTHNILDYQGLLFDCRKPIRPAIQQQLLKTIQPYLQVQHPIYLILPDVRTFSSDQGSIELRIFPYFKIEVEPAPGSFIKLCSENPPFPEYYKVLRGCEVVFHVSPIIRTIEWSKDVQDNIDRGVCGMIGASIFLLQPPLRRNEQEAFKVIVEHFQPEYDIPETPPPPSLGQVYHQRLARNGGYYREN